MNDIVEKSEWVPLRILVANSKHNENRTKIGLTSMKLIGTIESRINPDTKEEEYKITPTGKLIGLDWNSFKDGEMK